MQLADGSAISAGRSVSATGPWSPELTPGLAVRKRKGHLVITDRAPRFVRHQIVELGYLKSAHSTGKKDSVAFNIQPRKNGQMLIGSSRQFDVETERGGSTHFESHAATRVWNICRDCRSFTRPQFAFGPAIARLRLINCLYDRTECGEGERIWLATGHEGLGITTSLGTGKLLADLLLERPTAIDAAPFAPSRFVQGGRGP